EFGFEVLSCASTGNLAGAVAAHAARAGVPSYIFVPSDLEAGKLLGAAIYTPGVGPVAGTSDQVNRLSSESADRYHWASVTFNVRPVIPDTIAKSLAIGNPADGFYDLKIVKESGGAAEAVTDQEIVDGIKLLAQTEGIFAETAGGVTIACLKKLIAAGQVGR